MVWYVCTSMSHFLVVQVSVARGGPGGQRIARCKVARDVAHRVVVFVSARYPQGGNDHVAVLHPPITPEIREYRGSLGVTVRCSACAESLLLVVLGWDGLGSGVINCGESGSWFNLQLSLFNDCLITVRHTVCICKIIRLDSKSSCGRQN